MLFGNLSTAQATAVETKSGRAPLHFVRVNHDMRAVVVRGSEMLSDKLAALVGAMLDMDDDACINSITFRNDGSPVDANGICDHNTGSIAINLPRLFAQVCEAAQRKECGLSIGALWVLYVLATIGHEAWHLSARIRMGAVAYGEMTEEERETKADEHAEWAIIHLAKRYNIEPDMLAKEPYLSMQMQALFITEHENPWVIHQRRLIEEGLTYKDAAGHQLKTLRQYVRGWDPDRDNDPMWKADTFDVVITYHAGAEGKQTVFTPAATLPEAAPVVPIATAATAVGAIVLPAATPNEQTHSMVVEDMYGEGMVYSDEGGYGEEVVYYDAEDTGYASQIPVAAPASQTAAPAQAAAPAPYNKPAERRTYVPNNYTNEQIEEFGMRLYSFLDKYIFDKCGWLGNGYFSNVNAITDTVDISNVVPEDFVVECEGLDASGRWSSHIPAGRFIKGQVSKNAGVPMFTLHLNIRGTGVKRLVMPQNPNKTSRSASDAKAGNRITWIIKDDGGDKWFGSFTNGVFKKAGN
jgi:hypothetical protein